MSFNKTEKFLELARRAAASRQGISLDDVVSRYEVSFRTAQRMLRALEHQFPNTETWLDSQGRKRWRIPGGQLREFFSVSAEEVAAMRALLGPDMLLVTPGIRPAGAALADQKRVMTPAEAIRAGSDYLVVGRPVTQAADPKAAAGAIVAEIAEAC